MAADGPGTVPDAENRLPWPSYAINYLKAAHLHAGNLGRSGHGFEVQGGGQRSAAIDVVDGGLLSVFKLHLEDQRSDWSPATIYCCSPGSRAAIQQREAQPLLTLRA